MTRAPLFGSDLYHWIALRRVTRGDITTIAGRWFDAGRRVPGYVSNTLVNLRDAGLVTVIDPAASGGAQVMITDAGIARYDALCQQQQCVQQAIESRVPRHPGTPGPPG